MSVKAKKLISDRLQGLQNEIDECLMVLTEMAETELTVEEQKLKVKYQIHVLKRRKAMDELTNIYNSL
jgi:hypothetical protein